MLGNGSPVAAPKGTRVGLSLRGWRLAIAITIAGTLARLVIAALTPLFPDETYYWEFSRHLAAGYFDHPPAIAWLVRAGTMLAGDTALGVRLGSVVAGAVAALFACAAAWRLSGARAAVVASVVFAVMPISTGLILATPDAPMFAAAMATIYALVRVFEAPSGSRDSLAWWCIAGVALGVAFLSKYTAALLPLGILAAMLVLRGLRPRLAEPGPYVAIAIALLLFSPVVAWNASHEWVSFAFQLRHGLTSAGGSIGQREFELLGGQALLVTPVLLWMLAFACISALTPRAERRPFAAGRRVLAVAALVIFGFFVYSATKRRVEANWPALAYVPAIVLLASHAGGRAWRRGLRAGVVIAGFVTGATYVNSFTPILPVPARADPIARSAGWDELARVVQRDVGQQQAAASRRVWVASDRYQEASELAFHLDGTPETFALNLTSRRNNYDFWPGFADRARVGDALTFVTDDLGASHASHPTIELLRPHFAVVRRGEPFVLARGGSPVKHIQIWILDGWRGTWPRPVVVSGS